MVNTPKLPRGVRRLFRLPWSRGRGRDDVDDEMRFHLDMRVAELRALGMNQAEAEAEALRRMGDLEALRAELVRTGARQRRVGQVLEWLSNWALDVRLSTRRLLSSPLFTTGATLTMAIAIGATASVFGVVDGVLLKPFPVRDPSRVLYLQENLPPPLGELTVSLADYRDWRTQNHVFSSLAAMNQILVTVKDAGGSERVIRDAVTPNYFSALGMMPRLGRFLSADSTSAAEVVISVRVLAAATSGARQSVLGRATSRSTESHLHRSWAWSGQGLARHRNSCGHD